MATNTLYVICALFLVLSSFSAYGQRATVYISDTEGTPEPVSKDDPSLTKNFDKTKIEILTKTETSRKLFWTRIIMYFPLIAYFINLFWGIFINQRLIDRVLDEFYQKCSSAFLLDEKVLETKPKFLETSSGKHRLYLNAQKPVTSFILEVELLRRNDLLATIWNKLHGSVDTLEIVAIINSKYSPNFSLYFGRRSALNALESYTTKIKEYSAECTLDYKFPPYITARCDSPEILKNVIPNQFFDEVAENLSNFNCLYVTDIESIKDILLSKPELGDDSKLVVVKISLSLTSQRFFLHNVNAVDCLIRSFARIVQAIPTIHFSKEALQAITKSREMLAETKLKDEHLQRQEIAMKKKDDKVRSLRERMRTETDAEKQLKFQEKLHKQELKEKTKKLTKTKP